MLKLQNSLPLKARKYLCSPPRIPPFQRTGFALSKTALRKILKEPGYDRVKETALGRNKVIRFGIKQVKIKTDYQLPVLPSSEAEQYHKILNKNKSIKTIVVERMIDFPLKIIKGISNLQNLQLLRLSLGASGFIQFSQAFKCLSRIRNLSLLLLPLEFESSFEPKALELATLQFGKHLLSQKFLERIEFGDEHSGVLDTDQNTINLFTHFGELKKAFFEVILNFRLDYYFPADRTRGFLKKVEHVSFRPYLYPLDAGKDASSPRNALYVNGYDFQFAEIFSECSSLKTLRFQNSVYDKDYKTLGAAKNIRILEIHYNHSQEFDMWSEALLEAAHLEEFSLRIDRGKHLAKILKPIHKALKSSRLRKYRLLVTGTKSHSNPWISSSTFKNMCTEISNFGSLERLELDFFRVSRVVGLEHFRTLTKLKSFSITVQNLKKRNCLLKILSPNHCEFPVESLKDLQVIEELEIYIPHAKQKVLLQRLPRLAPSLKRINICDKDKQLVTIYDYQGKFLSNH